MALDLQIARGVLSRCVYLCSVSDVGSFDIDDPVLLEETGTYVSDSCMRDCVDAAFKAYTSNAEAGKGVANVAIDAGKQVLEISTKEVSTNISYGLIAVTVVVAALGVYYLFSRKQA